MKKVTQTHDDSVLEKKKSGMSSFDSTDPFEDAGFEMDLDFDS